MSKLLKSKILFVLVLVAVVALVGVSSTLAYTQSTTLRQGSTGAQVVSLQTALGITADGKFGPMTKVAVQAFQTASGLVADGVVGPMTGAALGGGAPVAGGTYPAGCTSAVGYSSTTGAKCDSSASYPAGCSSAVGYSPTTGAKCDGSTTTTTTTTTGGAGSVDTYELVSGLSNEEVGEDADDVKVAGIVVENSDGSDISITAVKLVFNEGTAASDFDDYAKDVSVWLGSTKVATVDADEFTDNNNWTKTVTLSGAIIKSGDTENLYVAISGISNLDTNDAADTWTVDITSVRFMDGLGALISEDPTVAVTTFSFESFATSADTELKITETGTANELVDDAHLINVHATDDTDNIPILAFTIEVEGDSDVNIDSLPVTLTSTETTGDDPDDLISVLRLFADGVEIGTESLLTTDADGSTEVVVFDDLDYDMNAGDKVNFVVKGKFVSVADDLDVGDTIAAAFGETETDLATFDAEDETGTNLADADKTGTANSTASEIRDVGFALKFVSSKAVLSHAADLTVATDDDQGTFTIVFDVTAFDGDIYLDGTSPTEAGTAEHDLTITGAETVLASSIRSSTGATQSGTLDGDARYRILEDDTERFEVNVTLVPTADGYFEVAIADLVYALTDVTGGLAYTFDLDDFKTPQLFLNNN